MLTIVISVVILVLVGVALYSSTRGGGSNVSQADLGGINAYDSYYGKDRFKYGSGPPCEDCERVGCIGAGQCSHSCHRQKKAS